MVVYWNENEIPVLPDRTIFFRWMCAILTMVGRSFIHKFIEKKKKLYVLFGNTHCACIPCRKICLRRKMKKSKKKKNETSTEFLSHIVVIIMVNHHVYFSLSLLYFVKGIHFLLSPQLAVYFSFTLTHSLTHSSSLVRTLIRHSYCSTIYLLSVLLYPTGKIRHTCNTKIQYQIHSCCFVWSGLVEPFAKFYVFIIIIMTYLNIYINQHMYKIKRIKIDAIIFDNLIQNFCIQSIWQMIALLSCEKKRTHSQAIQFR